MQRSTKIIYLIIFFSFVNLAFADLSKDEIFTKLKDKFSGAKAVSLNFTSEDNSLKGTLKAAKGNKFIINLKDRNIICNGKDLWNYSISDKKVTLSEYESSSSISSIDDILLNFTKSFKVLSLIKENSSKNGSTNVIILQNIDDKKIKNVTEVKLFSQGNFDEISAIEVKSKGNSRKYFVKNLQINPKLKDSNFEFSAPKGVELIDLR
jgi:outer membrane lipoprotein-sorting protein